MSYNEMKAQAMRKIDGMVHKLVANRGVVADLNDIIIDFQKNYGFGKLMIMKAFKPYIDKGQINIVGSEVFAIGLTKEQEQMQQQKILQQEQISEVKDNAI